MPKVIAKNEINRIGQNHEDSINGYKLKIQDRREAEKQDAEDKLREKKERAERRAAKRKAKGIEEMGVWINEHAILAGETTTGILESGNVLDIDNCGKRDVKGI